ncbi:MAG: hypothetical protein AAGF46_02305, partial [Pseudomonadota bacterium]
ISAALGVNYEHPSGFYTNFTLSNTGGQESELQNLSIHNLAALTIDNPRAGYRSDHYEIYLYATNLFDDEFVTQQNLRAVNAGTGGVDNVPNPFFNISDPQIVGLSLLFRL